MTYFLGAIPFALLVSRLKGINLREIGSGNIGATNVYRAMGFAYAFLVFLLDAAKGTLPVLAVMKLAPENYLLHVSIGFTAIAAHSLSVFVQFKGGKGAATGLGVLAALNPIVFAILFVIAAILIPTTRYVAPTTILCSILAPILLYYLGSPMPYVTMISIISLFIVIRHKDNIKRLLSGSENRV